MDRSRPRAPSDVGGKSGLVADYCDDDSDGDAGAIAPSAPAEALRLRADPPAVAGSSAVPTAAATSSLASPAATAAALQSLRVQRPGQTGTASREPGRAEDSVAAAPRAAAAAVLSDVMVDDDAAPPTQDVMDVPAAGATAYPAVAVFHRRLASLPPESTDEPPPAVMEKMRQYWAATLRVRELAGGGVGLALVSSLLG